MSENKCCDGRDFSRFDSMSTGELQEILRQDALQEGTESDIEMILYITEVLAKREKQESPGTDVQRAYRSFVQNYMPAIETETPKQEKTASFFNRMPRWVGVAAMLAIVLGLLLGGTAGANAMGIDLFGMVAHWTAEVFHFSDATEGTVYVEPNKENTGGYSSLQEALDKYKIDQRLVPTWIPNGYQQTEVEVRNSPLETSFYAIYSNGEEFIQISIRQLLSEKPEQVEKNEDLVQIYEVNGISYYLFQNSKRAQAVWTVGKFECVIACNLTIDEMKDMIDSI